MEKSHHWEPSVYWEKMKIEKITYGSAGKGVTVISPSGKKYSMGGIPLSTPISEGDIIKVKISFGRMVDFKLI